jgi:DNA-binding winged helix-turn-helix (wHTH) protein/Tol biopolymer transport system component
MPELSRHSPPFQLGAWRVEPATGRLVQGTEVRRARALVMDLLLHLAARAGEVVSKDELIAGAWGGAAIADSALTSTIAELRELLGDQPRSPRYIETLPKRGYRLIAPVIVTLPDSAQTAAPSPTPFDASATAAPAPPARNARADARAAGTPPRVGHSSEVLPSDQTGRVASDPDPAAATSASQPRTARASGSDSRVGHQSAAVADTSDRSPWMRRRRVAFALGAIFAVAAIVSIASIASNSRRQSAAHSSAALSSTASMMRLTIDLPSDVRLASATTPRLALTADGTRMAYVANTEAGFALYTRTLDQFVAQPIAGTAGASAPFFSPDGSRVGFFANGELRTVPISGGAATIVCAARIALGASWGTDDTIVFSGTHGRGLFEAPAAGGPSREVTTVDFARGELSHRWPQILPDGDRVLFTSVGVTRADAMIVSRRTGKPRVVVEQAQAATFVPPNRLVFERAGRLHVATIDPDRFELTGSGSSRVLVEDLASQGQGYGPPAFAAAGGGVLVYVPVDPHDGERDLVWVDRSGHVTSLDAPPRSYMHPRLSRDGRQVLTWLRTRDPDLWTFDIAARELTRLVTGVPALRPAWSPDGRQVMFDSPGPDNPVTLYLANVDGGKPRQVRPEIKHTLYAGTWTPDGRTLAYVDLSRTTGFDIIATDAARADLPTSSVTPILRTLANETAPAFSPDGRWLAFVSDVTGREQVYLLSSALTGAPTPQLVPVQVSTQGGREPVWSRRGDELFFRQGESLLAVRLAGAGAGAGAGARGRAGVVASAQPRPSEPVTLFSGDFDQRPSFQPSYDVAADGRFLMIRGRAPSTTDARIAVLLRWDRP